MEHLPSERERSVSLNCATVIADLHGAYFPTSRQRVQNSRPTSPHLNYSISEPSEDIVQALLPSAHHWTTEELAVQAHMAPQIQASHTNSPASSQVRCANALHNAQPFSITASVVDADASLGPHPTVLSMRQLKCMESMDYVNFMRDQQAQKQALHAQQQQQIQQTKQLQLQQHPRGQSMQTLDQQHPNKPIKIGQDRHLGSQRIPHTAKSR